MRRGYNYQPQMVDPGLINFGAVQMFNPEDTARLAQVGQNMQQRWDASQAGIAKYLEDVGAAKMRDVDAQIALDKLNQNLEDVYSTVNKDYQGDYGRAYNEVIKNLSKSRGIMHQAQKAYEEEQKYAPLITKLAAEKKLLFAPNAKGEVVDPRTQSVFNEKGEYVGGLDYSNIREKSDYDKTIEEAIVKGIDKTAVESGLINSKTAGYLMQLQQSGLAALTPEKIDQIAKEYAPIFEAQTTYGIDPERPQISSKEYVKDAIYRLASSKTGRQYIADRNYDPNNGKDDFDNFANNVDTFAGIAGVVPKENLELARQELSGIKGRTALGQSVVSTVTKFQALPELLGKWGYGLIGTFGPTSIQPAGMAGVFAYSAVAKQKEEITEKNIEKGIQELEYKVRQGTATDREKFLARWLKDDTNVDTPLAQAATRFYNLNNPSKESTRKAIKSYIKDFGTKSINPQIEIDYTDNKGNIDLKNLKGEDELFFGMNKDGAPTLTGAAVNTIFYDIETGEKMVGTDFIKENENNPVQGFAKYSADNPYSPGAKQIVVATKKGPKVYAMIPSKEKVAREALPWMFQQAKYYPEQQATFKFPNIKTGEEDTIEIYNKGKGKNKSNEEVEVLINGKNILDLVPAEGTPFTNGVITSYNGMSAENIAYKYYLAYLKGLK